MDRHRPYHEIQDHRAPPPDQAKPAPGEHHDTTARRGAAPAAAVIIAGKGRTRTVSHVAFDGNRPAAIQGADVLDEAAFLGNESSNNARPHGQRGQLRQRYREGQEDQLGALGLVVNAIVLWNTRYQDAALNQLRHSDFDVRRGDVQCLSPLGHGAHELQAVTIERLLKPRAILEAGLETHHARRTTELARTSRRAPT